ncbi:hypothetical protein U91I_03723 [alpha proteobacterium U9-1i]|nr:hypothetical protein U91I_03723 [alpha proteobacterium U9-1i]
MASLSTPVENREIPIRSAANRVSVTAVIFPPRVRPHKKGTMQKQAW